MTNPEIEKTMAEVREDVAGLFIAYHQGEFTSHEAPDKVFKLPVTIGGGVCKECEGHRFLSTKGKRAQTARWCSTCKGRGTLPVKTVTVERAIRKAIEEKLNE